MIECRRFRATGGRQRAAAAVAVPCREVVVFPTLVAGLGMDLLPNAAPRYIHSPLIVESAPSVESATLPLSLTGARPSWRVAISRAGGTDREPEPALLLSLTGRASRNVRFVFWSRVPLH